MRQPRFTRHVTLPLVHATALLALSTSVAPTCQACRQDLVSLMMMHSISRNTRRCLSGSQCVRNSSSHLPSAMGRRLHLPRLIASGRQTNVVRIL